MHSGLSNYQTKFWKATILALPCISYVLFNCPVVGQNNIITLEIATNPVLLQNYKFAKAYQYLLL